jgi:hypothetical protein
MSMAPLGFPERNERASLLLVRLEASMTDLSDQSGLQVMSLWQMFVPAK